MVTAFQDEVAPCFEAAKRFQIYSVSGREIEYHGSVDCQKSGPIMRLRLAKENGAEVIICNGIRTFYLDMLEAEGIEVYKNVTGDTLAAIKLFAAGKLEKKSQTDSNIEVPCTFELGELIQLTCEYFTSNGYDVNTEDTEFPIDIVASIHCPMCKKQIRVVICCSGHVFNWKSEVKELRRISDNYDAAVYVHASHKSVVKSCRDFKINLLDPWMMENRGKLSSQALVPILTLPVEGHERLYA